MLKINEQFQYFIPKNHVILAMIEKKDINNQNIDKIFYIAKSKRFFVIPIYCVMVLYNMSPMVLEKKHICYSFKNLIKHLKWHNSLLSNEFIKQLEEYQFHRNLNKVIK